MIEQRIATTPREANAAANELYAIAKAKTAAGRRILLRLVELDPQWRQQLRGAFHGNVLRDFAEQVWVPQADGARIRYSKAAWKEHLRDLFCPPEFDSTERMSDDEFAEFVLQSCAYGAIDWGIEFTESDRGAH